MNPEVEINKVQETLIKIKEKSDDDYEKNITYLCAGTLILSMTFIEKIVDLNNSTSVWIVIISWILLALTLLANLVSHQLSSYYHERTYQDSCIGNFKNVSKRNKIIRILNWGTTFGLVLGISFLIIFCSKNALKMANENKNLHIPNDSNYIEKGRTILVPLTNSNNTSSSSNNTNSSESSGQASNGNQTSSTSNDTIKK